MNAQPTAPVRIRMLATGLLLMLSSGLMGYTQAADQPVTIDGNIAGKLHLPDSGKPTRAVLLLHGWNGSMDEVGNLYADLAAALGARGIASLRFDYSGEGERVNYVVTSTLSSRIAETEAAYRYLRSQLPDAVTGVVGFSLGGLTAMEVVGRHPEWFSSMVLWSAAQEMGLTGDPAYTAAVRAALNEGEGTYQSYARITLTRDFVLSFVGVDASVHLAGFPGALLSIRGDKDFLWSHDRAWLARAPGSDKSFLLIGGADHIFNVLEQPKPNYGARVITATAQWFERTL